MQLTVLAKQLMLMLMLVLVKPLMLMLMLMLMMLMPLDLAVYIHLPPDHPSLKRASIISRDHPSLKRASIISRSWMDHHPKQREPTKAPLQSHLHCRV